MIAGLVLLNARVRYSHDHSGYVRGSDFVISRTSGETIPTAQIVSIRDSDRKTADGICVVIATSVLLPASRTMLCATIRGGLENRERTLPTIFFIGKVSAFCASRIVSRPPATMSVIDSDSEGFVCAAFSSVFMTAPSVATLF